MKDINSSPSNSKSEDTPVKRGIKSMKQAYGEAALPSEPPQDTSLDMPTLLEAIEQGGTGIYKTSRLLITGDISELKELLAEQQANLLQVIEDELVINAKPADNSEYSQGYADGHDCAVEDQRQALKKLKDNVINGGSL